MRPPRVVVVGHVERVTFGRVVAWPAAGAIAFLEEPFEAVGGASAVTALELARLGAEVELLTAVGDDGAGRACVAELEAAGVAVRASRRPGPHTRVLAASDAAGERTIVVLGANHLPEAADVPAWRGAFARADAVYLAAGDCEVLAAARAAPVLVAAARRFELVAGAGVPVDVLVGSATDPDEQLVGVPPEPPPRLRLRTEGAAGGRWEDAAGGAGRWAAAPLPPGAGDGDAYGAGDCFAAGLVYGLAGGEPLADALARGARCGAAARARRGP